MAAERLQKLIARAGITARRKAEEMITAGRVKVNDLVVTELGSKADPERDKIVVDGRRLEFPRTSTYIVLWKPTGVVTTVKDELNRRTVIDLVRCDARVFPVGQLDFDVEGVLLLTDDGDLAAALTHAGAELDKVYRAKIKGFPSRDVVDKLKVGVDVEGVWVKADRVEVFAGDHAGHIRGAAQLQLTMEEGKSQLIKRLLEGVGVPALSLRRVQFGPLGLDDLRPGKWRHLRKDEVARLRGAATRAKKKRKATPPPA